MRIVIDMQKAQAEFCFRGIRRTMALANAIAAHRGKHELFLALSGRFPDSIKPIRAAFKGLLPQENIRVWYVCENYGLDEGSCEKINELILDAFLQSLNPDIIHRIGAFDSKLLALCSEEHFYVSVPVTFSLESVDEEETPSLGQVSVYRLSYLKADLCVALNIGSGEKSDQSAMMLQPEFSAEKLFEIDFAQAARWLFRIWSNILKEAETAKKKGYQRFTKRRLAYVSPLPPERSGIADYSAELLPFLARFYEIDVVVNQDSVASEWVNKNCRVLNLYEFAQIASRYDRILYHFGNSSLHVHMFELLERFSGTVVLHDFFLSAVYCHCEVYGLASNSLWRELYHAHGYKAVQDRSAEQDEFVVFRYPCSYSVLARALGVIVHSENSLRLANQWYGVQEGLGVIPLLRTPAEPMDREQARKQLGLSPDDFLVCSFGFIGKTKHNHRLLDAWEASALLTADKHCKLVFVGDTDDSPYSQALIERVQQYRQSETVQISGWTDPATYRLYLSAADVAVQLRTLSRGETSAAVLDCMNYAIATIINANGSMADIPENVVRKIPDEFLDVELTLELERLRTEPEERLSLAGRAKDFIHTAHDPAHCAERYAQYIEAFYQQNALGFGSLVRSLAQVLPANPSDQLIEDLSRLLALSFPQRSPSRTLFLDVSVVARDDYKTGIQRAVRALTLALIDAPPEGYRIEPVYLSDDHGVWHYRYARDYTLALLNAARGWIGSDRIEAQPGDILLCLDLTGGYAVQADRAGVYRELQNLGVQVSFVVYDLIPVQFENAFPPGTKDAHVDWLEVVAKADSALCISQAVASDLTTWLSVNVPECMPELNIHWFHLGADLVTSFPSTGLPGNATDLLQRIASAPSFLMVGTVEPRKGHGQVLDAFDELWSAGNEINLVVVGKQGWLVDALATRFRKHPELGQRLHWLEGISDEYLEQLYSTSKCLIAASYGEGFGLPLIEAAQHKLPILARDIPVFREVAGEHASYFVAEKPEQLVEALEQWLELYQQGNHPKSDQLPWLTWKESAKRLAECLIPVIHSHHVPGAFSAAVSHDAPID